MKEEDEEYLKPSILDVPLPNEEQIEYIILEKLVKKTILSRTEKEIVEKSIKDLKVSSKDRNVIYAVYLLKKGFKTRKVFQIMGWSGFEKITALLLESLDMTVLPNFRFKTILGEKREIDVLAFRRPVILSVDCKNWLRDGSHRHGLKLAAEQQKQRTLELFDIIPELSAYTPIKYWEKAYLIPLVVSALENDLIIEDDVFIVPLSKLKRFVDEMLGYEEIFKLKWENAFYY